MDAAQARDSLREELRQLEAPSNKSGTNPKTPRDSFLIVGGLRDFRS